MAVLSLKWLVKGSEPGCSATVRDAPQRGVNRGMLSRRVAGATRWDK